MIEFFLELQKGILRKLSRFISFLIWYHMRKLNEHTQAEAQQAGQNSYEDQRFQFWTQQLLSFPTTAAQPFNPMSGQDPATNQRLRERGWAHVEVNFAAGVRSPAGAWV